MPSFRHHDFGNLYIQFDVKFPKAEDLRHLELLEKVLPPRPLQIEPPPDAMTEDFDLEDVDARGQARAQGATGTEDDEEDGVPHGAQRMQCANQ